MAYYSPLRYPGGKGKLSNFVRFIFEKNGLLDGHYVEPYAGGAGVALALLYNEYVTTIHINDINPAVHAFWHSALHEPDDLCQAIWDTPVTTDQWQRCRDVLNNHSEHSTLSLGFSAFFLNRTNRSGIIKGGMIGGKNQDGPWKIDARFNKDDLIARIRKVAHNRSRIRLYNQDAEDFLTGTLPFLPQKTLVYLDPPYYSKGKRYRLYENQYHHRDHQRIAEMVGKIQQKWLVSYDACPEILQLYAPYRNHIYGLHYSANKRHEGSEILIFSDDLQVPRIKHPAKIKVAHGHCVE